MKVIDILTSIIIPLTAIVVSIRIYKIGEIKAILKEVPQVVFAKVNKIKAKNMIDKFDIDRIWEVEIILSQSDRAGIYKREIILLGNLLDIDVETIQCENINFIIICNNSNYIIEIERMLGIEGKNILFENSNDLLIGKNKNIGILFRNENLIEQISMQSPDWKCSFKIVDLVEGINKIDKKYVEIL